MTTAQLLRKAADALDKGSDPLDVSFVTENDLSLDQLFTLAEQLAVGARIMAKAIEDPRSPQCIAMALTIADSL
jgi:hypothetical protein